LSSNKKISLILLPIFLFGQWGAPQRFSLKVSGADSSLTEGINSNIVAEIRQMGDSLTWFGTGRGLALHDGHSIYSYITQSESMANGDSIIRLPEGGIPAISVNQDTMAVAFSGDDGDIQIGLGLTITTNANVDSGNINWTYLSQPMDSQEDTLVPFAEGFFRQLPVTVPQANITYDATLSNGYLWTASWAGGLRRYDIDNGVWDVVPLPLDSQSSLSLCHDSSYVESSGISILKDYYLNPRDPGDGGNHNHKAFSVLVYGDTIWVGTANGINRGLLVDIAIPDSTGLMEYFNCIEWEHYLYPNDGLSGNFVVGLAKQYWNNQITIWAASMNADAVGEVRGLSYTRDHGDTWETALEGERVYNVYAKDSLVFAASTSGLWKSHDGENWAKFEPAIDTTLFSQKQLLTDLVYTVSLDKRGPTPQLWIGTPDGVALSSDLQGSSWNIFQTEYDTTEFYAYPNPFSPLQHNQLGDDGYVRFHTGPIAGSSVKLDIYNFAMEKVYNESIDVQSFIGSIKWDGRGYGNTHVANGVYFVRLTYAESVNQSPSSHWTKLIVVK